MNEMKKDHSIGAGTGAVAGALTGAALGAAAGPIGSVVGAVAGGVVGAKAGDSIAEAVNPTDYTEHFQREYRNAPYYNQELGWEDYGPAFGYGYETHGRYRGRAFDEVEPELERGWADTRGGSRLAWNEARAAVRDGWEHIEHARPGEAGQDRH